MTRRRTTVRTGSAFAYLPGQGFADIAANRLTVTSNFSLGEVLFFDIATRVYVIAELGDGPAQITEGYGGWNKVQRPRRYSLTQWDGTPNWTVTIPVMFDGLADNEPVEYDIRFLEKLARPGGDQVEPSTLIVDALGAVPHDFSISPKLRWVITDIQWAADKEIRRRQDGKRVRAEASVELFCVVTDDVIHDVPPAQRHTRRTGGRRHLHYVPVHKGETLKQIAHRNDTTVATLKKDNNIRDAKHWLLSHHQILVGPPPKVKRRPDPGVPVAGQ